jgi:hypothetical protein
MSTSRDRRVIRRSHFLLLILMFVLPGSTEINADELAVWNFNDSNLNVDHGSGTLTTNVNAVNVSFAAGTSNNARQGDVAGQSLQLQGGTGTTNNGRNITFSVSTLGYANIVVSFATQGTSTGFDKNQFQYSLDGITFVDLGAPYMPATTFGSVPLVFSLSSIVGLNNNSNAVFRIIFDGASSSTGNNRIDNIVVEGSSTTIPEPTTVLLLFSGLTGLYGLKRKRRVTG